MNQIKTWQERSSVYDNNQFQRQAMQDEIDALRQAIEQAGEVEPVAWMDADGDLYANEPPANWCGTHSPLYTRPPTAPTIPQGWKLLKDATLEERSWPEDYKHENGNYQNLCCECGRMFNGYKRRVVCKVCSEAPTAPAQPLSYEESWAGSKPCCGEYASCGRPCTPRGRWEAQQAQQPLTDEQIDAIHLQVSEAYDRTCEGYESHNFARAIESAHNIKETL